MDILDGVSSSQTPLIHESSSSFSEQDIESSRNIECKAHSERGQERDTQGSKSQNQMLTVSSFFWATWAGLINPSTVCLVRLQQKGTGIPERENRMQSEFLQLL